MAMPDLDSLSTADMPIPPDRRVIAFWRIPRPV